MPYPRRKRSDLWRIPAPRQARKMAGVALIGCLLFTFVAIKEGDFDWQRYTSIVGIFTLVCAGSWGLSALTAILYQSSRGYRSGFTARKRGRPWGQPKAVPIVRLPVPKRAIAGRALSLGALAAGAFLVGLCGVFLVDSIRSRGGSTSAVAVVRGSEVTRAEDGGEPSTTRPTMMGAAGERYLLCQSLAQRSCVIDGDTIRHTGTKIRIADIDTPEISEPKCASEAALGHRAKERLLDLLNKGPFDIVHPGGRDEDIYGRKLRVLIRDGRSLGTILVNEGLARPWTGRRRSWCL